MNNFPVSIQSEYVLYIECTSCILDYSIYYFSLFISRIHLVAFFGTRIIVILMKGYIRSIIILIFLIFGSSTCRHSAKFYQGDGITFSFHVGFGFMWIYSLKGLKSISVIGIQSIGNIEESDLNVYQEIGIQKF